MGFLSPAEATLIKKVFGDAVTLFGGYEDAERCVPGFFADEAEFPVCVLHLTGDFSEVTHRDVLGALMSLGITRDNLGDISLTETDGNVFVLDTLADYLKDNLTSVRNVSVKGELTDWRTVSIVREFDEASLSVASLRLDAVVGAVFHLSRTDACDAIRRGLVFYDYRPAEECDKKVAVPSVISLRGHGKAEISSLGNLSKKGRQFLNVKKYK